MGRLEEDLRKQAEWFENLLRSNPNKWTVLVFHHPIISPKATRDNIYFREKFKPLFDKYKVDLVLQGHDHAYSRGMKKIPMEKDEQSGKIYMMSVSVCRVTDKYIDKT